MAWLRGKGNNVMVPKCKQWLLVEKPGHFRDALVGLMRAIPGGCELSIADAANDAPAFVNAIQPELVIFGKGLHHPDLLAAIQQIKHAGQTKAILVLTGEYQQRVELLAHGADQVVMSDRPVGEIITAILQMNQPES
jgi:DNA-binding NarL/FixJ family response regulator